MSTPAPGRKAFEDVWRQRLQDAKLRLDFAHNYVLEVERDFPRAELPSPDGTLAHQKALRFETAALAEYRRVLQIYTDLMVRGTIPDESDWQRRAAADARGSENDSIRDKHDA